MKRNVPAVAGLTSLTLSLMLTGCGGSGNSDGSSSSASADSSSSSSLSSSSSSSSTDTTSAAATFPTGLAVGSPAEVGSTETLAATSLRKVSTLRYAADFAHTAWDAIKAGDWAQLASLGGSLLPIQSAHAAAASDLTLASAAESVSAVLSDGSGLGTLIDPNQLFGASVNANCYGPAVAYQTHEDASGGSDSGTLPTGDLGLWTETEASDGQPCVAAQLNSRVSSVKQQTMQGLLLMAAMRYTVENSSSLSMPEADGSTDLTDDFETLLQGYSALSSVNIQAATVALNSDSTTYTYRLVLDNGETGADARTGEIIMKHTPGTDETAYSGVMHIAGFTLSNDGALACSDMVDTDTSMYQAANVSSLRYARDGDDINFNARNGNYCGVPAEDSTDYAADVATFDENDELDVTARRLNDGDKGWKGFSRFAGEYDLSTVEGNFLYDWQAGTGDDKSRMLAMNMAYNSVTSTYTLQGFFGYADSIQNTDGSLLGMICNWAGPGNSHTPLNKFQSQTAEMTDAALGFSVGVGDSLITYAPTNSCDSTTTEYDVDISGAIDSGEGAGTTNNLDGLTGDNATVQAEIESRGFAIPGLF